MNYRLRKILVNQYRSLPIIETNRLILRPLNPNDLDDFYEYTKIDKVSQFVFWDKMESYEDAKSYLNRIILLYETYEYFEFAVEYKENHKMIGTCGFTGFSMFKNQGDVGYSFHPDYWGKGICQEALMACLEFGFSNLKLEDITACALDENIVSSHILTKVGMNHISSKIIHFKNSKKTMNYFKINKAKWFSK